MTLSLRVTDVFVAIVAIMGLFETYWLDIRLRNLSEEEKQGFFEALAFVKRRKKRPVKRRSRKVKPTSSRVKGEKKREGFDHAEIKDGRQ